MFLFCFDLVWFPCDSSDCSVRSPQEPRSHTGAFVSPSRRRPRRLPGLWARRPPPRLPPRRPRPPRPRSTSRRRSCARRCPPRPPCTGSRRRCSSRRASSSPGRRPTSPRRRSSAPLTPCRRGSTRGPCWPPSAGSSRPRSSAFRRTPRPRCTERSRAERRDSTPPRRPPSLGGRGARGCRLPSPRGPASCAAEKCFRSQPRGSPRKSLRLGSFRESMFGNMLS